MTPIFLWMRDIAVVDIYIYCFGLLWMTDVALDDTTIALGKER